MLKFSLQTALAMMVLAGLAAAIYSEDLREKQFKDDIEVSQAWLDSFNHHSIECLPYYRKAMQHDDPLQPFFEKVVACVDQAQKLIESMPDRSESDVSVVEVATMSPFSYTYAIHTPVIRKSTLTFYSASEWDDSLERHSTDDEMPFATPLVIAVPQGLSKLEVSHTTVDTTPASKDPNKKVIFRTLTPKLQVILNGEMIIEEMIPGFSSLGSNSGWTPGAKQQLTIDEMTKHKEFLTFRFIEQTKEIFSGSMQPEGKSFSLKFRLSASNAADGEQE